MKENAVLFYNDSYNERYYANLKHFISRNNSFSQINSCQVQYASFDDLKNQERDLDFPVYWDTDFQPVIFSTWIKDAISKKSSVKTPTKTSAKKSSNVKVSALKNHMPSSKNRIKPAEHFNNENDLFTSTQNDINKIVETLDIANRSIPPNGQTNTITGIRKGKSSGKNSNIYTSTAVTTQVNVSKEKNKSLSSHTSKTTKTSNIANQPVSPSTQTNVTNRKKKGKSSKKNCNLNASSVVTTHMDSSKLKQGLRVANTTSLQNTELRFLHKQINDSTITKSFQNSQCLNVSSDDTSSQKALTKEESQANSSKDLGSEKSILSIIETILPKIKTKAANSKVSNASTGKIITPNQENQTMLSKQNGNVSPSIMKGILPKEKKKSKTSEKPNKIDPVSTTSKGSFDMKSSKKKKTAVPAILTKKTIKNNATEKVKLHGKFAHMDLEKKNKDERHKMRAKKATFDKYANFDYDD